jgi:hypothetical protein
VLPQRPEDGAREGAAFIRDHIIRVTNTAFDDFAATDTSQQMLNRILGMG